MYYPPIAPQRRTNGYATAALVLGLVGLLLSWCTLCVPSILAVAFGHVALRDIPRTGQQGRSNAVAGLWMGYIPIGVSLIVLVVTAIQLNMQ